MTGIIQYCSPLLTWTLGWWIFFSGVLYQFIENAYGTWLRGLFYQLQEQWGSWGNLLGWMQ